MAPKTGQRPNLPALTPTDMRVLTHLADGLTHQEIADAIGWTKYSVGIQVRRLCARLGARNTPNAVHIAHQRGLLPKGNLL